MRWTAIVLVMMAASHLRTASAAPVRIAVPTPIDAFTVEKAGAPISRVIYLERCIGGCLVHGGTTNDAANLTSTIPNPGNYNITEFENAASQTGQAADAEWALLVQCLQEVYSPYDIEVTDVKPATGSYHLALIAGDPQQVGLPGNVLGVAPLASNCAAFDNVMSFSFANAHNQTDVTAHVQNVCWTAAQESAHAFGLDHEFEFVDGKSACSDPMTYRTDCGGQKFFRNVSAKCGRDVLEQCRCTQTQNSHRTLEQLFGPGTPLTGNPTVTRTFPAAGGTALTATFAALAGAKRGIAKVSLFMNGFPMTDVPGASFGPLGQGEQNYTLTVPLSMPDSVYDVFIRASDDLGNSADTPPQVLTKNAPCASSDACLAEQTCSDGRCAWPASAGELGDECTFNQFCKSLLCRGTADLQICTQTCEAEDPQACPSGLSCIQGVCFVEGGGCCSTSRGGWMPAGLLAILVLVGIMRRRPT